ncbi:MAG: hypothetical protein KKA67_14010 [Spirochaetes bacterium]|nr:hypothetical protein [Spirochaetota bacterium]MBU1080504.1 hypothetical protein [Spirochaetota bacterium]
MKHRATALSAILPLLLASCIGIDADVRIGTDGSVDATIEYTVSIAVDELGKLGANASYLPLPVGRDDLDLAARRAGGELRSWSRKDGTESFAVSASLRFPDAAAFAAFLDPAGSLASFEEAGGKSTLSIRLSGGTPPADKDLAEFIRVAFTDYSIAIRVAAPRNPSAADGFALSGRNASFSMKAADLYASPDPVSLTLSW